METRLFGGWSVRCLGGIGGLGSLALAAAFFLAPATARAQHTPYSVTVIPEPYQALPIGGGTADTLPISGDDSSGSAGLPFPVTFFDQVYSDGLVSTNGYITFGSDGTDWTEDPIPDTIDPNAYIAPWWDDQACDSGDIKAQTLGSAPAREYVVQWNCYKRSTTSRFNVQVWFTEGSSTIRVKYGSIDTNTWDAGVGIENETGTIGYAGLPCGTTGACDRPDFPTDHVIVYSQGPDLTVTGVTGEAVAYSGVMSQMEAQVRNIGGEDSLGFTVRFFVSTDETLSPNDEEVGTVATTQDAAPGQTVNFSLNAPIPLGLNPGPYYLLAHADPFDVVAEDTESNNVGVYGPFQVGLPAPDLVVESITPPTGAEPGGAFTLDWVVANVGNLVATEVPYAVVVSSNDVITGTDPRIHMGRVSVEPLASVAIAEEVMLPEGIGTGPYWLGILIDPDNMAYELDDMNNEGVTETTFTVSSGGLAVMTAELPSAEVGSHYCRLLDASGGDGRFTWSVQSGVLPPGLSLQEERAGDESAPALATLLCGTPSAVGTFDFTLGVTSAGLTAERSFALVVGESGAPLLVATAELPVAAFRVDYEASLQAVGGTPPYRWEITAGTLPPGMRMGTDGRLRGAPMVDGEFPFTVEVSDAKGKISYSDLSLQVASPARLTCVSQGIPNRKVGEAYEEELLAAGGTKPYTWSTVESRRLSNGVTDSGQTFVNAAPPGLILSGDGVITGAPAAAGRYVWTVEVTDEGNGAEDICTLTFEVSYDQGISVVTTSLADAYVDTPYRAELQAVGGKGILDWSLPPGNRLPEGLTLSEEGVISGMIGAGMLEGATERVFAFLVQVRDAENRSNVAPLSIILRSEPVQQKPDEVKDPEEGGCQAAGADGGLLALGAVLGLAALRRRR